MPEFSDATRWTVKNCGGNPTNSIKGTKSDKKTERTRPTTTILFHYKLIAVHPQSACFHSFNNTGQQKKFFLGAREVSSVFTDFGSLISNMQVVFLYQV